MALKAVGLPTDTIHSTHGCVKSQVLSLVIPDPGTTTATVRTYVLPFQLPWAQVLPHSTCQPPSPWAVLGQAVPEPASMLEEAASRRGAVSAAGS